MSNMAAVNGNGIIADMLDQYTAEPTDINLYQVLDSLLVRMNQGAVVYEDRAAHCIYSGRDELPGTVPEGLSTESLDRVIDNAFRASGSFVLTVNPGRHGFELTEDLLTMIMASRLTDQEKNHFFIRKGVPRETRCEGAASWDSEAMAGLETQEEIARHIARALTGVLEAAKKRGLHSLAIVSVPALGKRFSVRRSARAIVDAAGAWMEKNSDYGMSIEFCCDEADYETFCRRVFDPDTDEPVTGELPTPQELREAVLDEGDFASADAVTMDELYRSQEEGAGREAAAPENEAQAEGGNPAAAETAPPEEMKTAPPEEMETAAPEEAETAAPEEAETVPPEEAETAAPEETETAAPEEAETVPPEEEETVPPEETETAPSADADAVTLGETETAAPEETETAPPAEAEAAVPAADISPVKRAPVIFYSPEDPEYGFLSGRAPLGFSYLGAEYESPEDYAEKRRRAVFHGRPLNELLWSGIRPQILYRGTLEKFRQNPEAAGRLLETGIAAIVWREDSHVMSAAGKGMRRQAEEEAQMLMKVRRELRARILSGRNPEFREYSLDEPLMVWDMKFCDLARIPGAREIILPFVKLMTYYQPGKIRDAEDFIEKAPSIRSFDAAMSRRSGGPLPEWREMLQSLRDAEYYGLI